MDQPLPIAQRHLVGAERPLQDSGIPIFTALAVASKTGHLPQAFQAGENSSPALKGWQYVDTLWQSPSLK